MAELISTTDEEIVVFGPFRLHPRERRLEKHGERFQIGSRALDLLIALIAEPGSVVGKRELMARAWRNSVVDESNLRVNIAALRKALGEAENGPTYVANISGRGYSFVGPVKRVQVSPTEHSKATDARSGLDCGAGIPRIPRKIVGRQDDICLVMNILDDHQSVTIVGAGGVGKSMLVQVIADSYAKRYDGQVLFFDLDSVTDEQALINVMTMKLGVESNLGVIEDLLNVLRKTPVLFILDNCDALLDKIAELVETLCWNSSLTQIICTSREALRTSGEHIYRLSGLPVPITAKNLSFKQLQSYPSIQLFVHKCSAAGFTLGLNEESILHAAEICCRLDGHPLAIELAAGRINVFGLQGVVRLLSSSCRLQWIGRRNALPRHRSLEALIEHSYQRLTDIEKDLLLHFSVFNKDLSLEELFSSVITEEHSVIITVLDSLISKSIVIAQPISGGLMSYKLSETLRIFALDKLEKTTRVCTFAAESQAGHGHAKKLNRK